MTQWVALLYSVVLTPNRRLRSEDLLTVAAQLGFSQAKTVLSTGNLIFNAHGREADLAPQIEAEIARLGKPIPVLLRHAEDWHAMIAANPFPLQTQRDPTQVAVRIMRHDPDAQALSRLAQACTHDDSFAATPRALWAASTQPPSASTLIRQMGHARIGIGTFRNASALAKIAAALD